MRMFALGLALALSAHATLARADVVAVPIWIDVRRIDTIPAETTASADDARRAMAALRRRVEDDRNAIERCCDFSFHDRERRTASFRVVYDGRATPTEVARVSSSFTRAQDRCLLAALRRAAVAPVAGRVALTVVLIRE